VIGAPPAGADPVRLFNSVFVAAGGAACRGVSLKLKFPTMKIFALEVAAWRVLQHRSLPVNAVWTPQGEASWSIALRAGILTEFFDIIP